MRRDTVTPITTWLRKALNTLLEDFDLFGALAVGAFLLIAHYFHLIEDEKELPAAILTVLLAIVLISFRQRRKIEEVRHEIDSLGNLQSATAQLVAQTAEEPGVHWYLKRSDAEEDMLKDSLSSNKNVFIGVSQTSLTE